MKHIENAMALYDLLVGMGLTQGREVGKIDDFLVVHGVFD
jgi:hypothetical protein